MTEEVEVKKNRGARSLAAFGLFCIFWLPLAIWHGYLLTYLWEWFVEPLFLVPALTFEKAVGLNLVVSFLTHHARPDRPEDDPLERMYSAVILSFLTGAFAWGGGWVYLKLFF